MVKEDWETEFDTKHQSQLQEGWHIKRNWAIKRHGLTKIAYHTILINGIFLFIQFDTY